MEWFKFYHNKWMTDRAIRSLPPQQQLCFITLLCIASQSDDRHGTVTQYSEREIISLTGLEINYLDDENCDVKKAEGFTKNLIDRGIIEQVNDTTIRIKNFEKRQSTNLSDAERAKRYRDKGKSDERHTASRDERHARVEKSREDKIRVDKKEYGEFCNVLLSSDEHKKLVEALNEEAVFTLISELDTYIESTGKKYKSHYATLQGWARRRIKEHTVSAQKNKTKVAFT